MTAPVRRSGVLADALNAAFTLGLADAAEARAWLRDGGWAQFDAWIASHRGDPDDTEAQPEETPHEP